MKYEVTSLNTKKLLAASLKKFMETKPFSKITVSDIIADCGVNRKTFYYHFENIYALLKWMLEMETVQVIEQFDLIIDFEDAILFVMNYADENKHILNCAYDSMGRDELKRFFYADFIHVIRLLISSAEEKSGLYLEEDFKKLLSEFYAEALSGMLISWFREPQVREKGAVIKDLSLIMRTSLENVLHEKGGRKTAT